MPKSTLQDRVSERVPFGTKSSPPKFLKIEVNTLLCGSAAVGYAKSKQEILSLVRNIESKAIRSAGMF